MITPKLALTQQKGIFKNFYIIPYESPGQKWRKAEPDGFEFRAEP